MKRWGGGREGGLPFFWLPISKGSGKRAQARRPSNKRRYHFFGGQLRFLRYCCLWHTSVLVAWSCFPSSPLRLGSLSLTVFAPLPRPLPLLVISKLIKFSLMGTRHANLDSARLRNRQDEGCQAYANLEGFGYSGRGGGLRAKWWAASLLRMGVGNWVWRPSQRHGPPFTVRNGSIPSHFGRHACKLCPRLCRRVCM